MCVCVCVHQAAYFCGTSCLFVACSEHLFASLQEGLRDGFPVHMSYMQHGYTSGSYASRSRSRLKLLEGARDRSRAYLPCFLIGLDVKVTHRPHYYKLAHDVEVPTPWLVEKEKAGRSDRKRREGQGKPYDRLVLSKLCKNVSWVSINMSTKKISYNAVTVLDVGVCDTCSVSKRI